jgi:hypothetical protein
MVILVICNCLKLLTSIINEEQQGFMKNRNNKLIIRQIEEKSMEYNTPAYLCFIDLTKVFDRIKLNEEQQKKNTPKGYIKLIKYLNRGNTAKLKLKVNETLTKEIRTTSGIGTHSYSINNE